MFLKTKTNESTEDYWQKISEIRERLAGADAVLVGAGAGLSTAAGMKYGGERFENYFSDFHKKYGFSDMYSGGFYPFRTQEEYWAYWSRAIFVNRYDGAPMTMNLRIDNTFVQDSGWYAAAGRYTDFAEKYKGKKLLLLELGVGYNTPGIIKYPFWRTAAENKNAAYVCINYGEAVCPKEIAKKAICLDTDIAKALGDLITE